MHKGAQRGPRGTARRPMTIASITRQRCSRALEDSANGILITSSTRSIIHRSATTRDLQTVSGWFGRDRFIGSVTRQQFRDRDRLTPGMRRRGRREGEKVKSANSVGFEGNVQGATDLGGGGGAHSFGRSTRQFRATIGAAREACPGFEHLFVILRCRGVAKADAVG